MCIFRASHKRAVEFQVVIDWLILRKKCCVNMSRNLKCYVVMTGGKEGNSNI
jgi:hypothetical protein